MESYYSKIFVFLLILLSGLPLHSPAQADTAQSLSEERWKSLVSTVNYPPMKEKEKKVQKLEVPDSENRKKQEVWAAFFKILGLIVLIVLIVWGIASMAVGESLFMPKRKKITATDLKDISIEDLRENLAEAELATPIEQAEAAENYSLAIRLHYLRALQLLMEKKLIEWKKDKTNGQYVRELSGSSLYFPFSQLTRIFDYTEYGEYPVSKTEYSFYKDQFEKFFTEVRSSRNDDLGSAGRSNSYRNEA